MDVVFWEWISLMIRWVHVVAGIAWIGSSFYFVHLDLSLRRREGMAEGVQGDAWQVHGGGFYHMVKYLVAPARMPDELTWFKWEAYATWLSGFSLLVVVYYLGADLFLIDRSQLMLEPWQAAAISFSALAAAWLLYEALCRSSLGEREVVLAVILYVALVALTFLFTQVFSGRGAFTQLGALVGTIMVANVFAVIMPNQRKTVAALIGGAQVDPRWGKQAKQRSVHNNYLTLPVVFLMISNHYPLLYATRFNWVIVAIVLALGPLIRHFYNSRHAGKGNPWWTWVVAALGMLAIAWLSAQGPRSADRADSRAPEGTFAAAQDIVSARCAMCHAAQPVWSTVAAAPMGILLDEPEAVRRHARLIDIAALRSSAMPPGNVTEMTAAERQVLAMWLQAGAPGPQNGSTR